MKSLFLHCLQSLALQDIFLLVVMSHVDRALAPSINQMLVRVSVRNAVE